MTTDRDTAPHLLVIAADRDSVCAGDDIDSHRATFALPAAATVTDLLHAAWRACPLAGIAGGKATWVIDVGSPGRAIGVMAQQWEAPRLIVDDGTAVAVFGSGARVVFFRYLAQHDPEQVLARITAE